MNASVQLDSLLTQIHKKQCGDIIDLDFIAFQNKMEEYRQNINYDSFLDELVDFMIKCDEVNCNKREKKEL